MAIFKNGMAHKVRAFLKANPKAKPTTVAKELGIKPSVVHSTMWRDKKLGAPKRTYTRKAKREWNWDTVSVTSSDTPLPITMAEPEVDIENLKIGDVVGGLRLTKTGEGRARFIKVAKVDVVNHPPHYKVGGIEVIDFIQAKLTPEEFRGYLKGNVLKYTSRAGHKDDVTQDIGKLVWYANKLQETHTT